MPSNVSRSNAFKRELCEASTAQPAVPGHPTPLALVTQI